VFFFDEAHLLFSDLPQAMQEKVEQVVRLIRSKGVGVYFVSQNPLDIPDKVLGQLGNRVQHALRAFTPRDQKAVKAAAETFRANPKIDVEKVIGELGVGEALVSLLEEKGTPAIVERAFIAPPVSQLDPLAADERKVLIEGSELFGKYEQIVDRESAYEILQGKPTAKAPQVTQTGASGAPYDAVAAARARAAARQTAPTASPALASALGNPAPAPDSAESMASAEAEARLAKLRAEVAEREAKARAAQALAEKRGSQPSVLGKLMESAARSAASQTARTIMRGVLGSIFGGRR
jgi:DNA helicase HerA-like ATPase